MFTKIDQMNYGLSLPSLPILEHNFTEKELEEADVYIESNCNLLQEQNEGLSEEGKIYVMQCTFGKKILFCF